MVGTTRSITKALGVTAGAFVLTGGLLTTATGVMARLPLAPDVDSSPAKARRSRLRVRAVYPDRVHLDAGGEASRDGYLAVRQGGGAVHLRLGPVQAVPTPGTVARPILAADTGEAAMIGEAQADGFFWSGDPRGAHGIDVEEVQVSSPVGPMPAWQVPPAEGNGTTWAVLVHGHGSTRGEALRVIPLLRELGLTSLAITYRNDVGAPPSADRMRHLGADEWEDAESAISFALEHGARRIVLMGWSMGGGIALRTSVLSRHREAIAALVLDSPAVDWRDILIHQARALGAPRPMRELALWMMTSPWGRHLVHLHEPLALAQMHPEFYAEHLAHRTLLIHALEDTTVPPTPSRHLAELRPDLVDFVPVPGASHTREWNRDPAAYETMLARWLVDELDLEVDPADLPVPLRDPGAAPLPGSTGRRI